MNQLVSNQFGVNSDVRLAHITIVPRGLVDCGCRCLACNERLVAKQGLERIHHFAHESNRAACEVALEGVVHRYAKQILLEQKGLQAPAAPAP
jgi:competence protein CoiA